MGAGERRIYDIVCWLFSDVDYLLYGSALRLDNGGKGIIILAISGKRAATATQAITNSNSRVQMLFPQIHLQSQSIFYIYIIPIAYFLSV